MILTTFKDSLNEILKNGGIYIAIALAAIILITIIFLLINIKKS